jgi:hypothetical protein
MDDLRFGMSRMHRETGVHRNLLRYWISKGWLKRGRDGTMSLRDVQKIRDDRSANRKPKRASLALLSKRQKELVVPFAGPGGMRRLRRTINALAIVAREAGWTGAKKKRMAQALRAGANAVEQAQPTEARERQRSDAREHVANREDWRKWKRKQGTAEAIEDVVPPADEREVFEFVMGFRCPVFEARTTGGRAAHDAKIAYCMKAKNPIEMIRRAKKVGFKMPIRKPLTKPSRKPLTTKLGHPDESYEPDIVGEIDDRPLSMTPEELAAAGTEWLHARPRMPRVQGDAVTPDLIKYLYAHDEWLRKSPVRLTQENRALWLLEEVAKRSKWKWSKTDDGWGFVAKPEKSAH